jgi:hypothetical protein
MAELSGFWTTGGTAGDQQTSYTQAQWSTAAKLLAACSGFEGVAPGYLNGLAGTVTGANTVAINTGGGLVDGKWFINDASQNVNIPSASGGGNTRIDRIVLRATWANYNVSVTRIAGTDAASPTAPAITQTSGTTYDIKLYKALVNTSGTVTLTDERTWASREVIYRQGGDASEWQSSGTTTYLATPIITQVGSASALASSIDVTYPFAFADEPILIVSIGIGVDTILKVSASSVSGFTVAGITHAGAAATAVAFTWMAIGPRA